MCAWPRRAASSWGFLEGILQELDQGHRDAALASHVSQEDVKQAVSHVHLCFALAGCSQEPPVS